MFCYIRCALQLRWVFPCIQRPARRDPGGRRPADHRHARLARRHDDDRRPHLPPPPQPFGGEIERNAAQSKPALAGARRAAQGRAERPA